MSRSRLAMLVFAIMTWFSVLVLVIVASVLMSPWFIPLLAVPIVIILLLVWNVDG